MKGIKMKIALVLLAALMLLPLAGCGSDPSVLKMPEATAVAQAQIRETPAPITPLGDRTCYVGKETISESTLFSFVLTEETFDPLMGLTLKLKSTNKSNTRNFVVSLTHLSVNGYMQNGGYEAQVPAGQTILGEILIPAEQLRTSGVSSVEELILYPLIYDPNVPMGQGDVVDGAFSFYPTGQTKGTVIYPVRQKTSTEQAFFDNGFGTMILLDAKVNDGGDLTVNCYLENKTDRFLSFAWSDVSVNNTAVNAADDTVVAPGMRRYTTVSVPGAEISARGVTDPSEIAFKVSVTPLSNTGAGLSPLVEQRGAYRFAAASTGTDLEPDGSDEPDDGEQEAVNPAITPTPAPTTGIYTSPTSTQKKNAKSGYVNADKVNMRTGPGTKYKTVGSKIEENTVVTLYELQDGWWFLKCGNHYGYVKADYVSQGKPKATPATEAEGDGKAFDGTVNTRSIAALRKEADTESKCLKELSDGTELSVHYKTKGKDGKTWYYVSVGKTKGYIRSDMVKVSGKVPSK